MNTEQQFSDLLHRAADRTGPPPLDLVDAGIAAGRVRVRRRHRRRVAGAVAAVAVACAAATVGVGQLGADDPVPSDTRTVRGFGVTPDAMGTTLRDLLGPGATARPDPELPAALVHVLTGLGFQDPAAVAITRSGTADAAGSPVGVLVRRDTAGADLVRTTCAEAVPAGAVTECSRTDAGTLLLQFPDGAAVATLSAGNGWLVQVVTASGQQVGAATLGEIAQDQVWLR